MLLARSRFYFNGNLAVLQAKTTAAKVASKTSALPALTLGRKVASVSRGGVLGALTRASAPRLDKTRQFSTVAALYQRSNVHVIKPRESDPNEDPKASPRKWPVNSSKWAGYWLIASAVSVFGIVVLGGLTRLTESGLSITEWKPVTGSLPPMSEADWIEEFDKYKDSPSSSCSTPTSPFPSSSSFSGWSGPIVCGVDSLVSPLCSLPSTLLPESESLPISPAVSVSFLSCLVSREPLDGGW